MPEYIYTIEQFENQVGAVIGGEVTPINTFYSNLQAAEKALKDLENGFVVRYRDFTVTTEHGEDYHEKLKWVKLIVEEHCSYTTYSIRMGKCVD